jgi:hypothetical protein
MVDFFAFVNVIHERSLGAAFSRCEREMIGATRGFKLLAHPDAGVRRRSCNPLSEWCLENIPDPCDWAEVIPRKQIPVKENVPMLTTRAAAYGLGVDMAFASFQSLVGEAGYWLTRDALVGARSFLPGTGPASGLNADPLNALILDLNCQTGG